MARQKTWCAIQITSHPACTEQLSSCSMGSRFEQTSECTGAENASPSWCAPPINPLSVTFPGRGGRSSDRGGALVGAKISSVYADLF